MNKCIINDYLFISVIKNKNWNPIIFSTNYRFLNNIIFSTKIIWFLFSIEYISKYSQ